MKYNKKIQNEVFQEKIEVAGKFSPILKKIKKRKRKGKVTYLLFALHLI